MKTILSNKLFFALVGLVSTKAIQADTQLIEAVGKLHKVESYAWTRTTDTPGAPFNVPEISGQSGNDGFASLKSTAGGKSLHVIAIEKKKVIKIGADWKTKNELESKNTDVSADMIELITSRTPADELQTLVKKLISVKQETNGLWYGELVSSEAGKMMSGFLEHRAPRPGMKASDSSGTLRVWVKDGLPQKYVLTTTGLISLPFGKREVTRTVTVKIYKVGSTTVEIPASAKSKLELVRP